MPDDINPASRPEQVKGELRRVCRHESCVGREAIFDAFERLAPGSGDWFVQMEGNELVLYVIADGSIHEARAECKAAPTPPDEATTAKCIYQPIRITTEAKFGCEIERTEGGPFGAGSSTITRREFEFSPHRAIEIISNPEDDPQRADEFARALIREVFAPAALRGPLGTN